MDDDSNTNGFVRGRNRAMEIQLPKENQKDQNIKKCLDQSCRGSVISNKCNKCNQEVCIACKETKLENHTCDINTLKTIQSIELYLKFEFKHQILIYSGSSIQI